MTGQHQQLPPGDWAVSVAERSDHASRRSLMRGRLRGQPAAPAGWIDQAREAWLKLQHGAVDDPEAQLADAVAGLAGLPAGALRVPDGMWRARFDLVRGVDQASALALLHAAHDAGFQAWIRGPERPWTPTVTAAITTWGAVAFMSAVLGLGLGDPTPFIMLMLVSLPVILLALILSRVARWSDVSAAAHPLAYGADLRAHLAAGFSLPEFPSPESVSADPAGRDLLAHDAVGALQVLARLRAELTSRLASARGEQGTTLRRQLEQLSRVEERARRVQSATGGVEGDVDAALAQLEHDVDRMEAARQEVEHAHRAAHTSRTSRPSERAL